MTKKQIKKQVRRQYPKEFQDNAIRQVLTQGKSAAEVARELDIPEWKLRSWVRKAVKAEETGKLSSGSKTVAEELMQLRKELKALKVENEILKKASAYFAKSLT